VSRELRNQWIADGPVNIVGWADDVRPWIVHSDCVVLPSYREGLPRSILEGAAMGKPLIVTNVPGCREIVEHYRNGLLCEPRSAPSLAAIVEMIETPDWRRREWGASARADVVEKFSSAKVATAYVEQLRQVLS
jgi:glycosyltransferase involved in cell wall biosynthesis